MIGDALEYTKENVYLIEKWESERENKSEQVMVRVNNNL